MACFAGLGGGRSSQANLMIACDGVLCKLGALLISCRIYRFCTGLIVAFGAGVRGLSKIGDFLEPYSSI